MTTTLTRWSPVSDLLRGRMDRMFDEFLRDFIPAGSAEENLGRNWLPPVDIKETPETLTLTAELPGVKKEEVQITVENQVLTLRGERKFEKEIKGETYHRVERAYGSFARSFTLPANVKTDRVEASFANGLLTVTFPKLEEAKPRKIEIR